MNILGIAVAVIAAGGAIFCAFGVWIVVEDALSIEREWADTDKLLRKWHASALARSSAKT